MAENFEKNRFFNVDMITPQNGTISVKTKKSDREVILIVASCPDLIGYEDFGIDFVFDVKISSSQRRFG